MEIIQSGITIIPSKDVKSILVDNAHMAESGVWNLPFFVDYGLPFVLGDFVLVEI
jgi:hypothetical protein